MAHISTFTFGFWDGKRYCGYIIASILHSAKKFLAQKLSAPYLRLVIGDIFGLFSKRGEKCTNKISEMIKYSSETLYNF